ncbi:MAG: peptidoglycan DD-metalloendopeptidase family protein [Bacillota bacterium]
MRLFEIQKKKSILVLLFVTLILSGCGGVKELVQKESPHEKYEKALEQAGLLKSALGREWKILGEKTLRDSLRIKLPLKESGYFFSDRANALSYNFDVKRGEKLVINLQRDSIHKMQVFMDLFKVSGTGSSRAVKRVAYAEEDQLEIREDVEENQRFLLRVQPELMNSGRYVLSITTHPTLAFPVKGKNGKAIGSRFGDGRDGGKRLHEGVDIFAPKRNPVVAVTDGIITRVTNGGLGGKVVWMTNTDRQNFYYAHLDSQTVNPGEIVKEGEVLGLVGNTGNARFTSPHLHFGIYLPGEGAVDPYPYINDISKQAPEIAADLNYLGSWARVKSSKAAIKDTPDPKGRTISYPELNTPVEVYSAAANYYQVKLPDNTSGFIESKYLEHTPALKTLARLERSRPVFDAPANSGVLIEYLPENTKLSIYGEYNGFYLVRNNDYWGWVSKK